MKTTFFEAIHMNYLIKMTPVCLLTTLSMTSYAQTIKSAINSEAASRVKVLNLESEEQSKQGLNYVKGGAYKYTLTYQDITMKDVDGDGVKDAVAMLYYCEYTNCHPTTRIADLVVFKGAKKNQFTKIDTMPLGSHGKIKSINKGLIKTTIQSYAAGDASCCPSIEDSRSYKVKNKKLYRVE